MPSNLETRSLGNSVLQEARQTSAPVNAPEIYRVLGENALGYIRTGTVLMAGEFLNMAFDEEYPGGAQEKVNMETRLKAIYALANIDPLARLAILNIANNEVRDGIFGSNSTIRAAELAFLDRNLDQTFLRIEEVGILSAETYQRKRIAIGLSGIMLGCGIVKEEEAQKIKSSALNLILYHDWNADTGQVDDREAKAVLASTSLFFLQQMAINESKDVAHQSFSAEHMINLISRIDASCRGNYNSFDAINALPAREVIDVLKQDGNMETKVRQIIETQLDNMIKGGEAPQGEILESIARVMALLPKGNTTTAEMLLKGYRAIARRADNYSVSARSVEVFLKGIESYLSTLPDDQYINVIKPEFTKTRRSIGHLKFSSSGYRRIHELVRNSMRNVVKARKNPTPIHPS